MSGSITARPKKSYISKTPDLRDIHITYCNVSIREQNLPNIQTLCINMKKST